MYTAKVAFCFLALFALHQCCFALLGDRCPTNKCAVGHCNEGICLCSNTEVPSVNRKKCLAVAQTLGSGCEEEKQCTTRLGRFAHCTGHQCGCKPGSSVQNKVCKKSGIVLGDRCPNNHCDVGGCDHGVCKCRAAVEIAAPSKDACLHVATTLGAGCETDAQCTTKLGSLAHCINYQCGCKSNAVAANNHCQRK